MNYDFKEALLTQNRDFHLAVCGANDEEKAIRLNVYRNNVVVSLIDALSDIFPVTKAVVGAPFFQALARDYLLANPPRSPVLWEYGDSFADFVRAFPPAQSIPYLGDLAALEHSLLALTNNEEYPTLSKTQAVECISRVSDPETLCLTLPPTTQLLMSPFAIGSLYLAHQDTSEPNLESLNMTQTEYLLLVKSHLYARLYVLTLDEAVFIKGLLANKTLGEVLPESDDFDLGSFLAKLIDWQVFTHISAAEE